MINARPIALAEFTAQLNAANTSSGAYGMLRWKILEHFYRQLIIFDRRTLVENVREFVNIISSQ